MALSYYFHVTNYNTIIEIKKRVNINDYKAENNIITVYSINKNIYYIIINKKYYENNIEKIVQLLDTLYDNYFYTDIALLKEKINNINENIINEFKSISYEYTQMIKILKKIFNINDIL